MQVDAQRLLSLSQDYGVERRCRACDEQIADDASYCDICGVQQELPPKAKKHDAQAWTIPGGLVTLAVLAAAGLALVQVGFQFLAGIVASSVQAAWARLRP